MKVRQSASLVAGVCTLCVAASGSVTPLPVAAAADKTPAKPVVARPFELTATVDPLSALASFPFQSYILIQEALAGVAGGANGLGGLGSSSLQGLPAIVYQAITQPTATSNLQTLGAALTTALGTEQTALGNLGTLPARILALLAPVTAASATTNTVTTNSLLATPAATPAAATIDPLSALVSFPFQSYILIQEALAGVAGGANGLGGLGSSSLQGLPAIIYQAITQPTATSNLTTLSAALTTALGTESTAITNLGTLPARILALLAPVTAASATTNTVTTNSLLATPAATPAAATIDPLSALVSFPFQSYILIQEAVAGVLGGANGLGGAGASSLQGLPAIIYQAITQPTATSNLQTLGAAFQTALTTEQTAITNLGTLPARILALLAPVTASSATTDTVTTKSLAVTPAAATVDPISTLVSLPFQNYITVQEALAGAAGGGDGLGTAASGPKSLQGLPAIVYQAITQPTATSNLQTLGASFQTALATEQTALQNLATLPQRLITTDVNAISGLSGASTLGSTLKTETVTPTEKRVSLPGLDTPTTPSIKNPLSSLTPATSKTKTKTDVAADSSTDSDSTTTTTTKPAKKSGDNPVSNAVKALNKAAKDAGYTGKHRADDSGKKSDDGKGSDSGKGSKGGGSK